MLGMAQKLFFESQHKAPWKKSSSSMQRPYWPFLEKMFTEKRLSYVDRALAVQLLNENPEASEEAACFLCHLSMAARKGHLCIYVDKDTLYPLPEDLWQRTLNDEPESSLDTLANEDLTVLTDFIRKGAEAIPSSLVALIEGIGSPSSAPVCRNDNSYYFQRFWIKETQLIHNFTNILESTPCPEIDPECVNSEVDILLREKKLLVEQAQAILKMSQQSLTIICGGPGTGKTYTAAHLIKVLWNALSGEQRQRFEIALAAPTGKAAANLQKSLSCVISELEGIKPIKAKTLHRLLGIRSSKKNAAEKQAIINADLVLVDECSMIDVDLMASLFSAIKPGARLIMLGDPNQLPSVEAGGVFSDFVRYLRSAAEPSVRPAELVHCLRSELKEIVEFAQIIHSGDHERAVAFFSNGIEHKEIDQNSRSSKQIQKNLLHHAVSYFPQFDLSSQKPSEIIEAFNRFRILSPLRRGPYGVEALNELFKGYFEKSLRKNPYFMAPIILTKNNPGLELFNGETGVLISKNVEGHSFEQHHFQEGDYVIFPGDVPAAVKQIPAVLLSSFEYAYCISVHKSQGSEFDHVLLMLPERADVFGREVLYTAVTRAKKKLELWCSESVFKKTIDHQARRLSGIFERMK